MYFGDLVEAEFLVVIRSDPLGGIDRAFSSAGRCHGRDPAAGSRRASTAPSAEPRNPHLDAVEIGR